MRKDAKTLENKRLEKLSLDNYPWLHERHRIFPGILKDKDHKKILDVAAGIGVVAKRIKDGHPGLIVANDITESCLESLRANQLNPISFDLENAEAKFPFPDETFDAIISLATIEHILHLDYHMLEIRRILKNGGRLYISAPNYSGIQFFIPYVLHGRSFHNPFSEGIDKYEFYAHVRYFTYNTLLEFVSYFGFKPEKVYLPLPHSSSRYIKLKERSKFLAYSFKSAMWLLYTCLSPRWAYHPVIQFTKVDGVGRRDYIKPQKVVI